MSGASWNPSALGWWIAAFVLVLSQGLAGFDNEASIVEPLHESVMTNSAGWNPLLSQSQFAQSWGTWPAWGAAIPIAVMITWLANCIAVRGHAWLAGFVVVGLSLSVNTDQIIPSILIMLTVRLVVQKPVATRPFRLPIFAGLLIAAAMLTTIEFGMIILTVVLAAVAENYDSIMKHRRCPRATLVAAGLCAALIATACWWHPPFCHSLLRPLSCTWYAVDPRVVPDLFPPFIHSSAWVGVACLLVLVVNVFMARRNKPPLTAKILALFFGTIGLISAVNFWLSLVGLASVASGSKRNDTPGFPRPLLSPAVCILIAIVHAFGANMQVGGGMLEPGVLPRVVDSSDWNVNGTVLLTNLKQADDWKGRTAPPATTLLLDDRWDVTRERLLEYVAVCKDVLQGRQNSYRRSDGSWGGYSRFFQKWNPALIVIDSVQLQAIRQFSVDPNWSILSIDAKRTVFGSVTNSQTRLQARNATDLFYFLEWPNSRRRVSASGVLELGTAADARQVAAVLNAIRLPYAALRVLPKGDHPDTSFARAWSYTELAHRALRQTGRWSLIDQYRAVCGLKELKSTAWLNSTQIAMLKNRLDSLGDETMLSQQFPTEEFGQSNPLLSETETKIRRLLAIGDSSAASELLPNLHQQSMRDYYAAIESLRTRSIDNVSVQMLKAVESSDFPLRLQDEAFFYLGCLALEQRNPDQAGELFKKSQAIQRTSPLSSLRNMYLLQLGR